MNQEQHSRVYEVAAQVEAFANKMESVLEDVFNVTEEVAEDFLAALRKGAATARVEADKRLVGNPWAGTDPINVDPTVSSTEDVVRIINNLINNARKKSKAQDEEQ